LDEAVAIERLVLTFDRWWADLEKIIANPPAEPPERRRRSDRELLEEILERVRSQERRAAEDFPRKGTFYKLLATLTPREEQILRMRFGIGQKREYTIEEIAEQFAMSTEQVRQFEVRAFQKASRSLGAWDQRESET
jgi:RNA polymerase sigma factor (sigma-70 family)